jgi:polysaccharide pyruvyl transferase WcaK-like protein
VRYFLWGYYGHQNLGDDLMLEEIVGRVVAADPAATFLVRSHGPLDLPRATWCQIEAASGRRGERFVRTLGRVAKAIAACDVLLIGGGTLFLDKGRFSVSTVYLAFAVWRARRRRKPVHVLGVGIDVLSHPLSVLCVRYILSRAQSVALRDRFSMEYTARQAPHAVLSSDLLFNAAFVERLRRHEAAARSDVVVCVSEYLAFWRSPSVQARFSERLCELLRRLSRAHPDGRIVLCAFQKGLGDRDAEYSHRLAEELALPNLDVVAVGHADDAAVVFGRARLTISMRFHALVFSSILHCPFVGIAIETKIRELSTLFDMPSIEPDEFIADGLSEAVMRRALDRAISDDAVAREVARSSRNFAWLGGV